MSSTIAARASAVARSKSSRTISSNSEPPATISRSASAPMSAGTRA
jgi:hypothetical protein